MKTKLIISTFLTAFLVFSAYGKGPKGGPTRIDDVSLKSDFEKVEKGDQLLVACKVCDSMTIEEIETDIEAASYCQVGKVLTCASCKTKTVVNRSDKLRPRPRYKPGRNFIYVNEHGEDCLIVNKIVSKQQ